MSGCVEWGELREKILGRVTPSEAERRAIEEFRGLIEDELTTSLREAGFEAAAEVHGSAARGTWLKGERDIDVFIIMDPQYGREALKRVLCVVKAYLGEGWVEAYAEHPYLRAVVGGFDAEFVPCFRIDPKEGLLSATDRTPLHTRFVNEHLTLAGRDEVRLLKQFMRGVGVYGADVKVGGFSGYLCELLVILNVSFEAVLSAASGWRWGEVIDITGVGDAEGIRKRFGDPLIVVDPVDEGRNVASAVSDASMWTFAAAARAFLRRPAYRFFYPEEAEIDPTALLEAIRRRDSNLLFVVVEDDEVDVPDVLWGQLYKAEKAVARLLEKMEFSVIRSAAWSDEESRHILVFEMESTVIPRVTRFRGPPVEMAESSESFLQAHLEASSTVSGPWIEGRRWWVGKRRWQTDARSLLASTLRGGGRSMGIPRRLGQKLMRGHEILIDGMVSGHLHGGFTRFLDDFLRGRPGWLE